MGLVKTCPPRSDHAPVIAPWKMLALATLVWGCTAALAWVIRKAV